MSPSSREIDEHFMARALALAARGLGTTSPNPPVGAVVVRRGRVVGEGYHRRAGGPHAEALALRRAGSRARGATLYVTLEPCCHLDKRTPPCVPSIIASGVARVVVAAHDPNPKVRSRGLAALRRAQLCVDLGVGQAGAEKLIEPYRTLITTDRPFVTLKVASTLDGKIATARGESRWITGPAARGLVHFCALVPMRLWPASEPCWRMTPASRHARERRANMRRFALCSIPRCAFHSMQKC